MANHPALAGLRTPPTTSLEDGMADSDNLSTSHQPTIDQTLELTGTKSFGQLTVAEVAEPAAALNAG